MYMAVHDATDPDRTRQWKTMAPGNPSGAPDPGCEGAHRNCSCFAGGVAVSPDGPN
jgi:hypothetical protein